MNREEKEYPRILRLEETGSTNNYLREYIQKERLPEGSVVITENQTAGRGQIGNTWESEPGANLTFSVVLYPTCIKANRQFIISQITSLSVKETLDNYTQGITVKWPNDIYWNDKKICGMLIENDLSGQYMYCSVIGIGLNINQEKFTGPAPNPVSLFQITGKKYDREEIFDRFLRIFYGYYLALLEEKEDEIKNAYRSALYRGEGYYAYRDNNGLFEAQVYGIEPMGHILLQLHNGEIRRYAFKEVSYK